MRFLLILSEKLGDLTKNRRNQSRSGHDEETKRRLLTESLGGVNNGKEPDQGKALHNLISDPEAFRKEMTALDNFHYRTLAALAKPWKEASPELETISADLQSSDAMLAKFAPTVKSVHNRALRHGDAANHARRSPRPRDATR